MERIVRRGNFVKEIEKFNKKANEEFNKRIQHQSERCGIEAIKKK